MLKNLSVKLKTLHLKRIFRVKIEYNVEFLNLFNILDQVFHICKKKPLQPFLSRKGFYFTFFADKRDKTTLLQVK